MGSVGWQYGMYEMMEDRREWTWGCEYIVLVLYERRVTSSEQRLTVNTTEAWRGRAAACASGWVSEHEDGMREVCMTQKDSKTLMHQMRR